MCATAKRWPRGLSVARISIKIGGVLALLVLAIIFLRPLLSRARTRADRIPALGCARRRRWCLSVHQYVHAEGPCDRSRPPGENVGRIMNAQIDARDADQEHENHACNHHRPAPAGWPAQ